MSARKCRRSSKLFLEETQEPSASTDLALPLRPSEHLQLLELANDRGNRRLEAPPGNGGAHHTKSTPAEMWRDAMAAIESKVQSMPEPQQLLQEMASEQVRSSESLQTAMQREDAHASLSNSEMQEQDLRSAIAIPSAAGAIARCHCKGISSRSCSSR